MEAKGFHRLQMRGDTAIVQLTRGRTAQIDIADAEAVSRHFWRAICPSKGKFYAVTDIVDECGRRRVVYLHRFLMSPEVGEEVDHIDGDALNNRRANLRVCTPGQNKSNLPRPTTNTSGVKGVVAYRSPGMWRAQIQVEKRVIHLGIFSSKVEAAAAYAAASRKYHGEFGRTE